MKYSENKDGVLIDGSYIPFWAVETRKEYLYIKMAHDKGEIPPFKTPEELEQEQRDKVVVNEKQWQQEVLTKVEAELLFYAQDKQIPEIYSELRKTNYTEDDYYSLLGDRILLNEYLEQQDFPECGRPKLSGLVPG
ncbi:hypothetical protein ACU5EH_15745 [Aliivibrio salmonicida]|uniref:hypothetical protein n=1 Tax=Aliivibrio salmonicida TaxID=40269 RepID=UPI00406C0EFA